VGGEPCFTLADTTAHPPLTGNLSGIPPLGAKCVDQTSNSTRPASC
jgi:hypothetical protein